MSLEYFVNADISLIKSYDEPVIKNAFDFIANQSKVEFNYPQGGCQQRAQIMSLILQYKFNIDHCKLWLFSPAALTLNDCRPLFITDKNHFTDNNKIEWNYHVVPVVNMNLAGGIQQTVIDPSLDKNKPLELNEFFSLIGNAEISKYTFLLPDKYFFNTSVLNNQPTNLFDGSFLDFNNEIRKDLIMEKGLATNDMVMKIYHEHVKPLLNSNDNDTGKVNDLKAIFGNATAADLLFSQNISGNTENTTMHYVETRYTDIAKEARKIFYEQLSYWTAYSNKLMQ